MAENLTMDNIKAALEEHKKAIEERVNKSASAEDVENLRKVSEKLSEDIKSITAAIKIRELKHVAGLADEKKDFSISRAVFAQYAQQKGMQDAWSKMDAGFEKEAIDAYTQKMATLGSGANAGFLVPPIFAGQTIMANMAKMPLAGLGVDIMTGLSGDFYLPKQNSLHTAYSLGENEIPNASDGTYSQIHMSPKHIGARTDISRSLSKQSKGVADKYILDSISNAMKLKAHYLGINGTGGENQPKGLANITGYTAITENTNGGRLKIDDLSDMMVTLEEADAIDDGASLACLLRPIVLSSMLRERIAQYSGQAFGEGQPITNGVVFSSAQLEDLTGCKFGKSTHVPKDLTKGTSTTCSLGVFGDFSQMIMGIWDDLEIRVSDVAYDSMLKNGILVVANMFVDFQYKKEDAFIIRKDLETLKSKW